MLVKVDLTETRPGGESYGDLLQHMRETGYRPAALLHAHARRGGADAFADALFLPPRLHARLTANEPDYVCLDADDLRQQNAMLQKACDERLELINRLNEVAAERLRLIAAPCEAQRNDLRRRSTKEVAGRHGSAVSIFSRPRLAARTCLRAALGFEVFVETGTFEGATAALAASRVAEVHTVELSEEFYRRARERLNELKSVHIYHGDSAAVLKDLQPQLAGRGVLYWLDAHWCDAGSTAGAESQCPLLDELAAIGELNTRKAPVLIDDARLFLCPPAGSHRSEQWPSLDDLVRQAPGPRARRHQVDGAQRR